MIDIEIGQEAKAHACPEIYKSHGSAWWLHQLSNNRARIVISCTRITQIYVHHLRASTVLTCSLSTAVMFYNRVLLLMLLYHILQRGHELI
jgi:hypothetical protein